MEAKNQKKTQTKVIQQSLVVWISKDGWTKMQIMMSHPL